MMKNSFGSILFASLNVVNVIRKRVKGRGRGESIRSYFSSASCVLADRFWLSAQPPKLSFLNYEKLYSLLASS